MDQELLNILCCPKTKVKVDLMADNEMAKWNEAIKENKIKHVDGAIVKKALTEALITEDRQTIYRVDDGIPIMLIDQGIPVSQL